jgi:DnaJ-domain-containing protein 1
VKDILLPPFENSSSRFGVRYATIPDVAESASPIPSLADVFRQTEHKQSLCMLAVLSWVASCDGPISACEQKLLAQIAQAIDDAGELTIVEAAVASAGVRELEIACRYLKMNLDRGGRKLLAQLAITVAIEDGELRNSENFVLQFVGDLMGLSIRQFAKLYQQISRKHFPVPGDLSSATYWRELESGGARHLQEFVAGDDETSDSTSAANEPMGRVAALRTLGLDSNASTDAVRKAYRQLAKSRHPDRFAKLGPAAVATAAEAFNRVHDAYQVLMGAPAPVQVR